MAANQYRACGWCQYPLHQSETDCPECDKREEIKKPAVDESLLKNEVTEFDVIEIIRLGSRMNRASEEEHDDAYQKLLQKFEEFTPAAQFKLTEMVQDRKRIARFKIQAVKDRAETMHIPDFPDRLKCDRYGNLLVWEINKNQWAIVSFDHYRIYRVCYSKWAYLPAEPV